MNLKAQSVLSTKQFDKESLLDLFDEAVVMEAIILKGSSDLLDGKLMASIFFEPSTRTRFSFETAMIRLGGRVISNPDMVKNSSVKKRETLSDTGKVISQMVDVIAMRHPDKGSVAELAEGSDVPVLNAGDGAGDHPSQGLLDVYTIWKEKTGVDGLTIGMVGDLKYGRVPHAEANLLKHFNVKFVFISPEALKMPDDIVEDLKKSGCDVEELEDLESVISDLDVISMTRIQEERFDDKAEYEKYAGSYLLDSRLMEKVKSDAIILHPLPRVDEINKEVDSDLRAKYFDQVGNGVVVRMALLKKVLIG